MKAAAAAAVAASSIPAGSMSASGTNSSSLAAGTSMYDRHGKAAGTHHKRIPLPGSVNEVGSSGTGVFSVSARGSKENDKSKERLGGVWILGAQYKGGL
jgi:hypothetical protein